MSRRTSAGALIAAVGLIWGCQSVAAQPTTPYRAFRGPFEQVRVSEPTAAASAAPGPSYSPTERPAATPRPTPRPTGAPATRPPSPSRAPTAGRRIAGVATWYDYVPGGAAAGPALRAALGRGWRGTRVTVCAGGRCVSALLSDWCACRPPTRVVDLDRRLFAALADPSRGVLPVTVRW